MNVRIKSSLLFVVMLSGMLIQGCSGGISPLYPEQFVLQWGSEDWDGGSDVAVDQYGYIYVTGYYAGTADLDPGPGVVLLESDGQTDGFLSKFDRSDRLVWTTALSDPPPGQPDAYRDLRPYRVITGSSGEIFVGGVFRGEADFDPGIGIDMHASRDYSSIFLSKLESSGEHIWTISFSGTGQQNIYDIALDDEGNVYLAGSANRTIDFDPGTDVDIHTSINRSSSLAFVTKLNSDGEHQWARTWGGGKVTSSRGVDIDSQGNSYIAGYFREPTDFDPGPGVDMHVAGPGMGYNDCFLSKFNRDGDFQWAKTWGGADSDFSRHVAVDDDGNAYVLGNFGGDMDFDPGEGITIRTLKGYDQVFMSKFNPSGEFQWVRTWGCVYSEQVNGFSIINGNPHVLFRLVTPVNFEEGLISLDEDDDFGVIILSPSGDLLSLTARGFGTYLCSDKGAISEGGYAYLTGSCSQPEDEEREGNTVMIPDPTDTFFVKFRFR